MPSVFKRNLFYALLLLSGLGTAYGYWAWRLDPLLVGTVESRLYPVAAQEGGRVAEVLVETGAWVKSGQPLARLDDADLLVERQHLRGQAAFLEEVLSADRRHHAAEYDLLRLRVGQQLATARAELAELAALDREIGVLRQAQVAGLGRDPDMARLQIRHEALRQAVAGRTAPAAAALSGDTSQAGRDTALVSLLGDRTDRLHETRRRLALVEQRLEHRTVRAPCAGRIVEVTARPGVAVEAYRPVLTIEDPKISFVEVYLPEAQNRPVESGQPVEVYSRRADGFDTIGHIQFVHPGFTLMPERLWLRGQMLWARKLRIELAAGHGLLPGEAVQVRLLPDGG